MGKSKKRIFNKNKIDDSYSMRRGDAIKKVMACINSNEINEESKRLISIFGISAEELAESGATYEELRALDNLL